VTFRDRLNIIKVPPDGSTPKKPEYYGKGQQGLGFKSDKNDASSFHWVQFVRRITKYKGKEFGVGTEYATPFGNGKYGDKNWVVDSFSPNQVYYDMLPGVARYLSKNQLWVFDFVDLGFPLPAEADYDQKKGVFKNFDPSKYESYAMVDSFLIWDDRGKAKPLFEVRWKASLSLKIIKKKGAPEVMDTPDYKVEVIDGKALKDGSPLPTPYNVETFPGVGGNQYPNPTYTK